MTMRLLAFAMLSCTLGDALAGTTAIGTVSARGDLRVDGYIVNGDATLFDGTVVETGQASASLRLEKGVEIKLSSNTRGILHRDRLELQRGSSEWADSGPFPVGLNGLRVTPSGPHARGVVSVSIADTAQVTALDGELRVTNAQGILLAGVRPGSGISLSVPETGASASMQGKVPMSLHGTLSSVGGRYYLHLPSPDLGVVYELKGTIPKRLIGKQISVKGAANLNDPLLAAGAAPIIAVSTISEVLAAGAAGAPSLLTVLVGSSAAADAGIFVASHVAPAASR